MFGHRTIKKICKEVKYRPIKNNIVRALCDKEEILTYLRKKYAHIIENREDIICFDNIYSNKIWICWFQGREQAPELVQKCIALAEGIFSNREVIVIDDNNFQKYADFPDYIVEKYNNGIITKTHLSDLLRVAVLTKFGGLWLDATVLCTANEVPDYVNEVPLFVYKEVCLDRTDTPPIVASSWMIYSCKNNDIIKATRDLMYEYWKYEKELKNYFVMHLCFRIATDKFSKQWEAVPVYNNVNPHILQFELLKEYDERRWKDYLRFSDFHKLNRRIENNNKEIVTNYDFIMNDFKIK